MKLHTRIAVGLVAGALLGILLGPSAAILEPLGTLFIRLVRMIIVPLVASSLIVVLGGFSGRGRVGRMGARAFVFTLVSLAAALLIGLSAGFVFEPGSHLSEPARASLLESVRSEDAPGAVPARPSVVETLLQIVPGNILEAAVEGNMLQVLFVSVLLGLAVGRMGEEQKTALLKPLEAVSQVMVRLVGWVMHLAPLGVLGLVASVVGRSGLTVIVGLGFYLFIIVLALAAHVLFTYTLVLTFFSGQGLARFYRAIRPPLLIAFGTCSTAAALPVSLEVMQREMRLSSRVALFTLPLGTAIGRDGSGIYQAVSVLFIAQVYGHSLGAADLITLGVTTMLAALAVASVPAAGFVNLAILLSALGLPLEGGALVLGVERIADMLRTSVNLIGQLVGATYVATAEGERVADGTTATTE